jgi:hypothetical protein
MSSSFNTPQGIRVFPTIVYVSGSATVDNVSIPRRALGCFRRTMWRVKCSIVLSFNTPQGIRVFPTRYEGGR